MNLTPVTKTKEQIRAADPAKSVWVTANAGSGKTHVLVERVISLLLAGAEPSSILCITFTKAAASEMSSRLFSKLSQWTILDDQMLAEELTVLNAGSDIPKLNAARRLFARALETPGGLQIQTIHAFCEKLLQQFPIEAGVHPGFRVLDERQNETLLVEAISSMLQQAEAGSDKELNAAMLNCVSYVGRDGFETLMRQFLSDAKGLRKILDSGFNVTSYETIIKNSFGLELSSSSHSLAEQICRIDRSQYREHAKKLATYKIYRNHDTAALLRSIGELDRPFELLKQLFLTADLSVRKNFVAKKTSEENPLTAAFLEAEQSRYVTLIEQHDILLRIEATLSLFKLARVTHQKIVTQKQINGYYDFDDLINRTANLLNSAKSTQWVLYKLDAGLKHILIDEAQDTSPVQWNIISALCEEFFVGLGQPRSDDRTLFVVGDRKQSIYSFQGADIRAFTTAKANLTERIESSGKSLDKIDLTISYRSVAKILGAVDKVFPPGSPARLGFAQDDTSENPHQSNRFGLEGVFELWPLVGAEDAELEDDPWQAPVDQEPAQSPRRRLAKIIAQNIKSWLGRREIISRGRLVKPGDILILLQSRGPLFSMLIAALRKEGVPVSGADRLRLRESLAVQDLLILIQWLHLPQDDHALACILKSPLVPDPLDERGLMNLALGRGQKSLWNQLCSGTSANVEWLSELTSKATLMGPYEFIAFVLIKFRKSMSSRLGFEAIDATDAFLDQALVYEMENGRSLAGFLHWFQAGETTIKREMDQSSGEVRLMTVHGAKGLESNIVILADAASVPQGGQSDPTLLPIPNGEPGEGLPLWSLPHLTVAPELQKWKDSARLQEVTEHNRLLYVAMTRACDELYVCGVKTTKNIKETSWYAIIEKAVGAIQVEQRPPELDLKVTTEPPFQYQQPLPLWLTEPAPKEAEKASFALTSLVSDEAATGQTNPSVDRGIAIHYFLQMVGDLDREQGLVFVQRNAGTLGFEVKDAFILLELIRSPPLDEFFGPDSQSEVELRGTLPGGQEIVGRVDRILFSDTKIIILDYKTDHFVPDSSSVDHKYTKQMALYVHVLKDAYPAHAVEAALFWTQTGKLEWLSHDLLTQARDQVLNEVEPS